MWVQPNCLTLFCLFLSAGMTINSINLQALEVWEKLIKDLEVSNPSMRANTALNGPMQRLRYIPLNPGASACLGAVQMSRSSLPSLH